MFLDFVAFCVFGYYSPLWRFLFFVYWGGFLICFYGAVVEFGFCNLRGLSGSES